LKLQTTYKNKTQLHDNFFQSTLLIKRLQRYQKNTVHNVHQFQFWDAKNKITLIFTLGFFKCLKREIDDSFEIKTPKVFTSKIVTKTC
jgi:hypothetical protein